MTAALEARLLKSNFAGLLFLVIHFNSLEWRVWHFGQICLGFAQTLDLFNNVRIWRHSPYPTHYLTFVIQNPVPHGAFPTFVAILVAGRTLFHFWTSCA
jgi:hypothetical protein